MFVCRAVPQGVSGRFTDHARPRGRSAWCRTASPSRSADGDGTPCPSGNSGVLEVGAKGSFPIPNPQSPILLTAIRPPEFAPRVEVAALLLAVDRFVLADTFAFSRQSFHNRARILTDQGPRWLTVPRQHAGVGQPLLEVEVLDGWRRSHRAALRAAYGQAPFYEHIAPEWDAVLEVAGSLADLSVASTQFVARWLRAPAEIVRASALPGAPRRLDTIARVLEAESLLTLPESAPYDRSAVPGLEIGVLEVESFGAGETAEGVSVLHLLMHYGPATADLLRRATRVDDL